MQSAHHNSEPFSCWGFLEAKRKRQNNLSAEIKEAEVTP